jgi:hypothetical protein
VTIVEDMIGVMIDRMTISEEMTGHGHEIQMTCVVGYKEKEETMREMKGDEMEAAAQGLPLDESEVALLLKLLRE